MSPRGRPHSFEVLTAALGGRRVYPLIWGLWLFLAICGYYAQMLSRREAGAAGDEITLVVGILGLATYAWLLIRGLSSKARREALLAKQPDPAQVSRFFRLVVWIVPPLALGAALAPAVVR